MIQIIGDPSQVSVLARRFSEAAGSEVKWAEDKHPRGHGGKFARKGEGAAGKKEVVSSGAANDPFVEMGTSLPNVHQFLKDLRSPNKLGVEPTTWQQLEKWSNTAIKLGQTLSVATKLVGETTWKALPKAAQLPLRGFAMATHLAWRGWQALEHNVLMKGREFTHRFATQLAKERGLTDEQVNTVSKVTLTIDTALAWTLNIPLTHWGMDEYVHANHMDVNHWALFAAAKVGYFLPTGSLAYCAYAMGTQSPLKTVAAAWKVLLGKDVGRDRYRHKKGDHHESEHEKEDLLYGPKLAEAIAARLALLDPKKTEWWTALFLSAFDMTQDVQRSLSLADEHVSHAVPDITEPADLTAPMMEYRRPSTSPPKTKVKEDDEEESCKEEDRIDDNRGIRYEGPRGGSGWRDFHNGKIKYEGEGWDEEKHPRKDNGQFGQGHGESKGGGRGNPHQERMKRVAEKAAADKFFQGNREKIAQEYNHLNALKKELASVSPDDHEKVLAISQDIAQTKAIILDVVNEQQLIQRDYFLEEYGLPPEKQAEWQVNNTLAGHEGWSEAEAFLRAIVSADVMKKVAVQVGKSKRGRSYYEAGMRLPGWVMLTPESGAEVAVHEFGHHIEMTHDKTANWVEKFHREHFDPKDNVNMAEAFPEGGFTPDEIGNPDDMEKLTLSKRSASYMGKTYPDGSTELMSMGLEYLFKDPIHFMNTKPEFFALVMQSLQG